MFKTIFMTFVVLTLLFLGISVDSFYFIFKSLLFNKDLFSLFSTLIAGLFGFVVAIVPLAIHIFNQNTDFINKLTKQDSFNFYIKPLFYRFISFLKSMFCLFVFILFILIIKDFASSDVFKEIDKMTWCITAKRVLIVALFIIYVFLIKVFLFEIYTIIRDLQSLIQIFFKIKKENQKDTK